MINLGKTIRYNLQSSRLYSFHETNILLQWQKIVEGLQTLNDPFCFCVTAVFWVRFAEGSVWRISTLVLVEESFRCSCYLLLLKYTNNNLNGCVTTDARVAGWIENFDTNLQSSHFSEWRPFTLVLPRFLSLCLFSFFATSIFQVLLPPLSGGSNRG